MYTGKIETFVHHITLAESHRFAKVFQKLIHGSESTDNDTLFFFSFVVFPWIQYINLPREENHFCKKIYRGLYNLIVYFP